MRLLIISHAINMDGRAASQTVTDKIPYFQAAGLDLVVVSAITGERDTRFTHHQVLPLSPVALRFDLRHYFRKRFPAGTIAYRLVSLLSTLVLGIPLVIERLLNRVESQTSWAIPAYVVAWRSHRQTPFDLVLSSGGAMAAHVAGYWMKSRLGLPWVAEIHDPLVYAGWDKSSAQLHFSEWLEEKICSHADAAVWFTQRAMERARRRYPTLGDRGHVIYAGVDQPQTQSDSKGPRTLHTQTAHPHAPQIVEPAGLDERSLACSAAKCFVFAHFGSLSRSRSLKTFIQGLHQHLKKHPAHQSLVRVEVYGTSLDADAQAFAQSHGLQDVVRSIGRLERDEASGLSGRDQVLRRMSEVDCLILLHGSQPVCEEYIPSKLYEYLWMGPVILAGVWKNPELEGILSSQGHIAVASDDVNAYAHSIEAILEKWQANPLVQELRPSPYTAKRSAQQLIALLNQTVAKAAISEAG